MSYKQYGISEQLVEKIKKKMKNPVLKEKVKKKLEGITKSDLQQPLKVKSLISSTSRLLGVKVEAVQAERIQKFVLDQKIDPNNTFHLIKLWSMFR